jgi:hypothetical protein
MAECLLAELKLEQLETGDETGSDGLNFPCDLRDVFLRGQILSALAEVRDLANVLSGRDVLSLLSKRGQTSLKRRPTPR